MTGRTPARAATPGPERDGRPAPAARARYLVIGLVIGALWIAHRDEPVWEHAVRTLLVLAVVPLVAAPVLARWRTRRGSPAEGRVSLGRFVAAKALLVGVALGVDVVLSSWFPGAADLVVAGGLVVAVAVLGPRHHHRLLVPADGDPGSTGEGGERATGIEPA